MELMVCPVEKSHEVKYGNQGVSVAIKKGDRVMGVVEVNRGDIDTENVFGIDQLSLRIEK